MRTPNPDPVYIRNYGHKSRGNDVHGDIKKPEQLQKAQQLAVTVGKVCKVFTKDIESRGHLGTAIEQAYAV